MKKLLCCMFVAGSLIGCGGGSSTSQNQSPQANAGEDLVVEEKQNVVLSGSASDPDGDIRDVSWSQTSGISVIIADGNTFTPSFDAPDIVTEQSVEFELTVTDNQGARSVDVVTVTIRPLVWEKSIPLNNARWGLTACSHNNQIFVFGGADYETNVDVFDIETQLWEERAPLATARRYGAACAVVGEKIYLVGGYNALVNLDVYDVASGTWSSLSPMPTGRHNLAVAAVNNKLYAIGGRNGSSNNLSIVEEYDIETDNWNARSNLPVGHHSPSSQAVDGLVYVFGGFNSGGDSIFSYVYDPEFNVWSEITFMPTARSSHSSAIVSGKIYLFGGGSATSLAVVEEYDPIEDVWTEKTQMPLPRHAHTSTAIEGAVFILGGRESSSYGSPLSDVSVYNALSD